MKRKSYVGMVKDALDRNDIEAANGRLKEGLSYYGGKICKSVEETPTVDIPLVITNLRAAADALEAELCDRTPESREFVEWLRENMKPKCSVEMDGGPVIPFRRPGNRGNE